MPKVRVHNFSMSIDGYLAGPDQSQAHLLGAGGERLFERGAPDLPERYECAEHVASERVTHVRLVRR